MIEKSDERAIIGSFKIGIVGTGAVIRPTAHNMVEGLPGDFDQQPLRIKGEVYIGHDNHPIGADSTPRPAGLQRLGRLQKG